MVRRIVVVNPKGGSGKTSIATNLAAYYAAEGHCVALIDEDPQGSSTRWLRKRPDENPHIHGIEAFKTPVGMTRAFAHRLPLDVQTVVVDTPAALVSHELADAVRGADKILVPVLPSDIDTHAATRVIADLLLRGKVDRTTNRLAIVANRVKRNTVGFRSLMRFLDSLGIPVAAVLRDAQSYIRSAESGLGLHELASPTATDVEQWVPLIEWIEHDAVRPARSWLERKRRITLVRLPDRENRIAHLKIAGND